MFRGKFIGAIDKNNVEICVGDKVKGVYREKEFTGQVVYHQRGCSFFIETSRSRFLRLEHFPAIKQPRDFLYKDIEVVYSTYQLNNHT